MSMLTAMMANQRAVEEKERQIAAVQLAKDQLAFDHERLSRMSAIHAASAREAVRRQALLPLGGDQMAEKIACLCAKGSGQWKGTMARLVQEADLPVVNLIHAGRQVRKLAPVLLKIGIRLKCWHVKNTRPVSLTADRSLDDLLE